MELVLLLLVTLVVIFFWKTILEFIFIAIGFGVCVALPICRNSLSPLLDWWWKMFWLSPGQVFVLSVLAVAALFALGSFATNYAYLKLAPGHLRAKYPTWGSFKALIKDVLE